MRAFFDVLERLEAASTPDRDDRDDDYDGCEPDNDRHAIPLKPGWAVYGSVGHSLHIHSCFLPLNSSE